MAALPKSVYTTAPMTLPAAVSEEAVLAELKALAGKSTVNKSFVGQGCFGTQTPGVMQRNVPGMPGFVHRLQALPAQNFPGPARGAAEFPDSGWLPDRHGHRQRVHAR